MTIIKSLGFGKNKDIFGHHGGIIRHRTHRSIKNRNPQKEKFALRSLYKKKLETIRIKELENG